MSERHAERTGQVSNLRIRELLNAIPEGGEILDIGCVQHDADNADSENWVHHYLYDIGDEVLGLDFLESEITALNKRGYNVVCADAQDFSLDQEFDTVVAGEIIEHLSDLGGFLESIRAHLKDDGQLVLTTPNPWAFHRFKQALVNDGVRSNPEHTCWLDERTLTQLLSRHGFSVERFEYVRPTDAGVTRLLYDAGFETIGGTSLLVVATIND